MFDSMRDVLLPVINLAKGLEFVQAHRRALIWVAAALVALWLLQRTWQRMARWQRRRRPPTIHPKLQKYNLDYAELNRQRREQAAGIIATSTGSRLVGYRLVRQVEAVFVEGYRSPEDALAALKADASERGANALINVKTERTSAGKCAASGDAVLVAPLVPKQDRPDASP